MGLRQDRNHDSNFSCDIRLRNYGVPRSRLESGYTRRAREQGMSRAWSTKRKMILGVQYYFFRLIIRCRVSKKNTGSGRPPGEDRSQGVAKYEFLQDTIVATLVGEGLFQFGCVLSRKSEGCGAALAIPSATTFVLGGVSELGPPRKVSTGTTRNNSHKHHTHHTLSPWRQTASSCSPATATLSLLN